MANGESKEWQVSAEREGFTFGRKVVYEDSGGGFFIDKRFLEIRAEDRVIHFYRHHFYFISDGAVDS